MVVVQLVSLQVVEIKVFYLFSARCFASCCLHHSFLCFCRGFILRTIGIWVSTVDIYSFHQKYCYTSYLTENVIIRPKTLAKETNTKRFTQIQLHLNNEKQESW